MRLLGIKGKEDRAKELAVEIHPKMILSAFQKSGTLEIRLSCFRFNGIRLPAEGPTLWATTLSLSSALVPTRLVHSS
jgi:hypothetical protein